MWVTHEELQTHIQERAQSRFGAVDIKKPKQKPGRRESGDSAQLDPASLLLPHGVFVTNCGTDLPQLSIDEVQKDARGVAFATASDAQRFLTDGKLISAEGLALLVVGTMPENLPPALPMHALRVPAIYKGTNEPIILDVMSIQLGDQAVYRKANTEAPELAVCPTKVMRVHVFRDVWEIDNVWADLTAHPVRSLVQLFPILRLCRVADCDQECGMFHPSLEEEGVESGLLDIWAFRWHGYDGSKMPSEKAEVLSVYIRIPESSFEYVHQSSGFKGFFFEPRNADAPGPDDKYAVVWVPQLKFGEAMHRARTLDHCIAVCRLGHKHGIRCLAKHQEALHSALCPNKPFVDCPVKTIYRLEPLPAGTQRASLVATLRTFGWNAKPLQPCKGSQGKAWQVGTSTAPPAQFIEAQHGWIGISKIRDAAPVVKTQSLIATARTKQHIHDASASTASSSSAQDPWQAGVDPWGATNPRQRMVLFKRSMSRAVLRTLKFDFSNMLNLPSPKRSTSCTMTQLPQAASQQLRIKSKAWLKTRQSWSTGSQMAVRRSMACSKNASSCNTKSILRVTRCKLLQLRWEIALLAFSRLPKRSVDLGMASHPIWMHILPNSRRPSKLCWPNALGMTD